MDIVRWTTLLLRLCLMLSTLRIRRMWFLLQQGLLLLLVVQLLLLELLLLCKRSRMSGLARSGLILWTLLLRVVCLELLLLLLNLQLV